MTPLFSATNTRPSGEKRTAVGWVSPEKTISSWKPGGSDAASAGRVVATTTKHDAIIVTARSTPTRVRALDELRPKPMPAPRLFFGVNGTKDSDERVTGQPTSEASREAPAAGVASSDTAAPVQSPVEEDTSTQSPSISGEHAIDRVGDVHLPDLARLTEVDVDMEGVPTIGGIFVGSFRPVRLAIAAPLPRRRRRVRLPAPIDGYRRGKSVSKCPRTRGHIDMGHRTEVPVGRARDPR